MKKIRDFFYNFSDIFVTFLVLALASGIIFWKVHTVMGYSVPEEPKVNPGTETKIDIDFSGVDLNPETEQEPEQEQEQDPEPENPPAPGEDFRTAKEIQVEIPKGASRKKAGTLVAQKLGLSDADSADFVAQFIRITESKGYSIKYGNYTVPAGSSIEEIIKVLSRHK